MLLGNLAIVRLSRGQRRSNCLECVVEGLVVKEYPVVVVAAVEAVFDLTDRACNVPHIGITSQGHECRIHARAGRDADQVLPLR